jgi:hypothetical protein
MPYSIFDGYNGARRAWHSSGYARVYWNTQQGRSGMPKRLGCALCTNQPMDPTTLWYFHLHSIKAGSLLSLSDSGIASIGRLER